MAVAEKPRGSGGKVDERTKRTDERKERTDRRKRITRRRRTVLLLIKPSFFLFPADRGTKTAETEQREKEGASERRCVYPVQTLSPAFPESNRRDTSGSYV